MNKVALITGSTSGIGFALSEKLLGSDETTVVLISGTKSSDVESKANELSSKYGHDRVKGYVLDVTDESSIKSCFNQIQENYGKLDLLFNNAGVNFSMNESENSLELIDKNLLSRTLEVNTIGPILVTKYAIPLLKKSTDARIINTSSEMASLNLIQSDYYPLSPSYRISKVALNAVTTLLAKELQQHNITVNSFSPGWTRTKIGGDQAPFSVEEASETAILLGTSNEFRPNGDFFAETRKFGGPIKLNW